MQVNLLRLKLQPGKSECSSFYVLTFMYTFLKQHFSAGMPIARVYFQAEKTGPFMLRQEFLLKN